MMRDMATTCFMNRDMNMNDSVAALDTDSNTTAVVFMSHRPDDPAAKIQRGGPCVFSIRPWLDSTRLAAERI